MNPLLIEELQAVAQALMRRGRAKQNKSTGEASQAFTLYRTS